MYVTITDKDGNAYSGVGEGYVHINTCDLLYVVKVMDRELIEAMDNLIPIENNHFVDFPVIPVKYSPENCLTEREKFAKMKEKKAFRKMCKRGK